MLQCKRVIKGILSCEMDSFITQLTAVNTILQLTNDFK